MVLRFGSRGPAVEDLQTDLNRLVVPPVKFPGGISLKADEIFGKNTLRCFRAFQVFAGIKNDGACGPISQTALRMHLGSLPKAAPPKARTAPTPKPQGKMTKEQVDEFVRENTDNYETFVHGMGDTYDDFLWFAARGVDVGRLLPIITATEASLLASSATGIGNVVVISLTSIVQWARALESSEQTYGYRGSAYATAAWAFNRPVLDKSAEMRQRALAFHDERQMARLDSVWELASQRTILDLNRRYGTGPQAADFKRAVQLAHRENVGKFCRKMLKNFEGRVTAQQKAHWVNNYQVVYPM